jgi:hypothetical protein
MTLKSILVLIPLLPGCVWIGARGRDLGDIVRVEGSVGVGLQANVTVGELLHLGVGSSRRSSAGWAYGIPTSERRVEDHFPLSLVESWDHAGLEALHVLKIGAGTDPAVHRCPIIAPATFESGRIRKPAMQFWNLEIGVMAVVVGAEVGVNPAELVDFVLGWFGIDIGGDDDPEARAHRRLWIPASPELLSER